MQQNPALMYIDLAKVFFRIDRGLSWNVDCNDFDHHDGEDLRTILLHDNFQGLLFPLL